MKIDLRIVVHYFVITLLALQTMFFSVTTKAQENEPTIQITMTTNGQPYLENEIAVAPVEIMVRTSEDSAIVEISHDIGEIGEVWEPLDAMKPYVLVDEGQHTIWFRVVGSTEQPVKRMIIIQPLAVQSLLIMPMTATVAGPIIFVNENAVGANNGTSWGDAFVDLQSALDEATAGQQIWIAAGTYIPSRENTSGDPRSASFQLKNDVSIYGGFFGNETDLTERNWELNETVLSGDVGNSNVDHVFYNTNNINSTAKLDGVTIQDGYANGKYIKNGGGMYNDNSSPTLENITFKNNNAVENGGALANVSYSSPSLTNVKFIDNKADSGGALYNNASSNPVFNNVTFQSNLAIKDGGAISNNLFSEPTFNNVIFKSNTAVNGGAIINNSRKITITNGLFTSNTAKSTSAIKNKGQVELNNVTISGNESTDPNKLTIDGGIVGIYNSIIVGNHNESAVNTSSFLTVVEDSLLAKNVGGEIVNDFFILRTNFTSDKYELEDIFVDPAQHNYHLRGNSPALNKGDIKDNNLTTDLEGNPRFRGANIDLGAYEELPYSIIYDENNGNGAVPVDLSTYDEQDSIAVKPPGTLMKQSHTFNDWNTAVDGTGDFYKPGDTITVGNKDIILYATWKLNPTYKVEYHENGATSGDVPQDTNLYKENMAVTVAGNSGNLARTGHLFEGWNTAVDGTGNFYKSGDTITVGNKDLTLYATWKLNPTYKVEYHGNGSTSGIVPQDTNLYEENMTVTVAGNSGNLVRTGHRFKGWNTAADGTGKSYTENKTLQMGLANVILYAEWTSNSPSTVTIPGGGSSFYPSFPKNQSRVSLTFNSNGGTFIEPFEIDYNTKISGLPVPKRKGYLFEGWYENAALTKQLLGESFITENLTFYAKWSPIVKDEQPEQHQEITFIDTKGHWAEETIKELVRLGIIQGYEDGTFRPDAPLSRMHVALLLTRAFKFESIHPMKPFSDVQASHKYYAEIYALQQAEIIDGANGAFLPNENMTRAQLAKILIRVLGLKPEGKSSFSDVNPNYWSAAYIAVLEREGIGLGDNGKFYPNKHVTRAEFVTFLYRLIQIK